MSEDARLAPAAFILGVDIEEVYAIFGESFQLTLGGGLPPEHYDQIERKAQRVRDALRDFQSPVELIQRFEAAASRVYRAGDPRTADLARVRDEGFATSRVLSALMHEVRGLLRPDDAALYDVGVMLARLHLCLRVLIPSEGMKPPELRDLYAKELARVVPLVRDFLAAGEQAVIGAESEQFSARVRSLAGQIEAWDGGSEQWCRAARERVERVFAAAGALARAPFGVPPSPADELSPEELEKQAEAGVRAFEAARQRAQELFSARDFAAAERVQRDLIEECRRRIGFDNPFTLSVRADLSFTLLARERGDLAADLVYDLAADAERTFGEHHPNTARTYVHTLLVLMATRSFDECAEFLLSRLGWLYKADPATLDPELAEVHRELIALTSGSTSR